MSSLTQFEGRRSELKGVGLIGYLVEGEWDEVEHIGETNLPVLYEFFRKPVDMMGQFVVFRYNGEEHVPDLSIPIRLKKVPVGGRRVPDQAALRYWLTINSNPPEPTGIGYARIDERLTKVNALLRRPNEVETIGETACPVLYEYELSQLREWQKPEAVADGSIVSFDTLPPGARRIPDQAALRCWITAFEGGKIVRQYR